MGIRSRSVTPPQSLPLPIFAGLPVPHGSVLGYDDHPSTFPIRMHSTASLIKWLNFRKLLLVKTTDAKQDLEDLYTK